MVRSSKQRYRTNCQYFTPICKPQGKYILECTKPWYRRCRDTMCDAGLPNCGGIRRRRKMTNSHGALG